MKAYVSKEKVRRDYESKMKSVAGIDFKISGKADLEKAQKICVGKIVKARRVGDERLAAELSEAKEFFKAGWFRGRCRECGVKISSKATHCSTHRNSNALKSLPLPKGFQRPKGRGGRRATLPPNPSGISTHDIIRFPDGPVWIGGPDERIDRIPFYRELEKILKRNLPSYLQFKFGLQGDEHIQRALAQGMIVSMIDASIDPKKMAGSMFETIYKVSPAFALDLLLNLRRIATRKPNSFQRALVAVRKGEHGKISNASRKRAQIHLGAINRAMFGDPAKTIIVHPNGS